MLQRHFIAGEGAMVGKLCTGRLLAVLAVLVLLAGGSAARAQPAYLVRDLDSSPAAPASRFPQTQAALGGFVGDPEDLPQPAGKPVRRSGHGDVLRGKAL